MLVSFLLMVLLLSSVAYYLGKRRSVIVASDKTKVLHSLPGYYGLYAALWLAPTLPVLAVSNSVTSFEEIGATRPQVFRGWFCAFSTIKQAIRTGSMHGIRHIGDISVVMLRKALNAYDQLDETEARQLICQHESLDVEFQSGLRHLVTFVFVMEDSRNVGHMVVLAIVIKAFERIGDQAKKIAENIVFRIEGQDLRHSLEAF